MLTKCQQQLVMSLMRVGAFKVDTKEGFRLSLHDKNPHAPRSPFYLNLRTDSNPKPGPLTDDLVRGIAIEIVQAVAKRHIRFDAIAGIPNAGRPFAQAAERYLHDIRSPVAHVSIMKSEDSKGLRRLRVQTDSSATNGSMEAKHVLLIDDLVTSKTMKEMAAEALLNAGHKVAGIGVYLDRSKSGIRKLSKPDVPLASVLSISDMLAVYREQKMITEDDAQAITRYLAQ